MSEDLSKTRPSPQLSGLWAIDQRHLERIQTAAAGRHAWDDDDDQQKPPEIVPTRSGRVGLVSLIGTITKYPAWYDRYCGFVPAELVRAAIAKLAMDPQIDGIILLIDSPGGMVDGSVELAEYVERVSGDEKYGKPIVAVVSDLCASAALWVASQCRSIRANPTADIGSIGVYQVWCDDSKFWSEHGFEFKVVSSGGIKGAGADGKITQDLLDYAQAGINAIYEKFITAVAAGRQMGTDAVRALADGRCHLAEQAKQLGLIDEVASRDAALEAAFQEITIMIAEQFRSHAAENPEAAEVKELIVKGHKAGEAQAHAAEITRLTEIAAACPGRPQLAIDAFVAGQDAGTVKLTVAALDREKSEREAADVKSKADLAAKDAEIERLKTLNGSQAGIGTAGAGQAEAEKRRQENAGEPGADAKTPEDRAKAEWAANHNKCQEAFVSEKVYAKVRVRELNRAA